MNHLEFVGSSSHPPKSTYETDHTNIDVINEWDEDLSSKIKHKCIYMS